MKAPTAARNERKGAHLLSLVSVFDHLHRSDINLRVLLADLFDHIPSTGDPEFCCLIFITDNGKVHVALPGRSYTDSQILVTTRRRFASGRNVDQS